MEECNKKNGAYQKRVTPPLNSERLYTRKASEFDSHNYRKVHDALCELFHSAAHEMAPKTTFTLQQSALKSPVTEILTIQSHEVRSCILIQEENLNWETFCNRNRFFLSHHFNVMWLFHNYSFLPSSDFLMNFHEQLKYIELGFYTYNQNTKNPIVLHDRYRNKIFTESQTDKQKLLLRLNLTRDTRLTPNRALKARYQI